MSYFIPSKSYNSKPLEIVKRIPSYTIEKRNVLDIGVGTRRVVYNVIAINSSKQAVDELSEDTKKENLPIECVSFRYNLYKR